MIKGSIQEKDIKIVNIYAPNIGTPQFIRPTLTDIKEETDSNTIIVGDFNTTFTQWTDHEMDFIDIFRDIPSKCRRIYLLKCTWNILQDR